MSNIPPDAAAAIHKLLTASERTLRLADDVIDILGHHLPLTAREYIQAQIGCGKFDDDGDDQCGVCSALWWAHKRMLDVIGKIQEVGVSCPDMLDFTAADGGTDDEVNA